MNSRCLFDVKEDSISMVCFHVNLFSFINLTTGKCTFQSTVEASKCRELVYEIAHDTCAGNIDSSSQ